MKGLFKNLILSLSVMCLFVGCGNTNRQPNNVVMGASMKASYEMMASKAQVDSICVADTLPSLESWTIASFKDYETGSIQVKRMYIKKNDTKQIIYIILGNEQPYKVTRRITE